jgi:enoyl-CoA hydratase/carnithine racemase
MTSEVTAAFFAHPVVAAVLGTAFGAGLIYVSRWSFRLVTPESGYVGLAASAVALLLRMVVAAAALLAYVIFARPGFPAFATATLVSFFVLYAIELVRYGGLKRWLGHRRSRGSR